MANRPSPARFEGKGAPAALESTKEIALELGRDPLTWVRLLSKQQAEVEVLVIATKRKTLPDGSRVPKLAKQTKQRMAMDEAYSSLQDGSVFGMTSNLQIGWFKKELYEEPLLRVDGDLEPDMREMLSGERRCGRGVDVLVSGKDSATSLHLDVPTGAGTLICLLVGKKEMVFWHVREHERARAIADSRGFDLPLNYHLGIASSRNYHLEELRAIATELEGGCVAELDATRGPVYVFVPPFAVHGAYNHEFCVSVNKTVFTLGRMPDVVRDTARLMCLVKLGMRGNLSVLFDLLPPELVGVRQGGMRVGDGLYALFAKCIDQVAAQAATEQDAAAVLELGAVGWTFEWGGRAVRALCVVECLTAKLLEAGEADGLRANGMGGFSLSKIKTLKTKIRRNVLCL